MSKGEMSPEAKRYLDAALDLLQKNSVKRKIDWKILRADAYAKAVDAKTSADTYPAIRAAVAMLGDHHSKFFTPTEAKSVFAGRIVNSGMECVDDVIVRITPGGPADKAGLTAGTHIVTVNGQPYDFKNAPVRRIKTPFTVTTRESARTFAITPVEGSILRPPTGRLIDGKFAYLDVPTFGGPEPEQKAYAQTLHDLIREFDVDGLKGWIIDLRLNNGGNMWPMIAGLGPLFPPGDLGAFVDGSGRREKWTYKDGKSFDDGTPLATTPRPHVLKHTGRPIAVLTDQLTASSGEAVVIAFRGLKHAITIGRPTFGVPTGNMAHKMSDGAILNLCQVLDVDRTGKTYDSSIPPDLFVSTNWPRFNQPDDRAIVEAIRWLEKRR